jgi:hypothetical protein
MLTKTITRFLSLIAFLSVAAYVNATESHDQKNPDEHAPKPSCCCINLDCGADHSGEAEKDHKPENK